VQCNVSLVGQWIEEAKSKLKDPGLVYSYHGAGRKRDAEALAANSIVVTTYETLASDATYHAKQSGLGAEYAAPCEQVRWWRIICDESHVLRNGSTKKTSAILNLVGDNKWLVSGKSYSSLTFVICCSTTNCKFAFDPF
jgi:SNF2 family DNA or RNA helicase